MERLKTIEYVGGAVRIIDQTVLPTELKYISISTISEMYDAIKVLKVRGAPAIGIAAAFGLVLGIRDLVDDAPYSQCREKLDQAATYLSQARPTAVNLFWAIQRMQSTARTLPDAPAGSAFKAAMLQEAGAILSEDRTMCRAIGEYGFEILRDCTTLLTHCNAGGLATSEYGTALAPIYIGQERGKIFQVYSDETRPLLQGSRITAFELQQAGIPVTVICDNMAAAVMARMGVDAVIVGADRIAANGDTANKIGTYGLALVARAHNVPFYVAAPFSTFDTSITNGSLIPIEERDAAEITCGLGKQTAPDNARVFNPAFDVTPHHLITAIITDKGVLYPPFNESIRQKLG